VFFRGLNKEQKERSSLKYNHLASIES